MKRDYPHYHLVPKDLDENLSFRGKLLRRAAKDEDFASALRQMCAEDALFYMNTFAWTYDPRDTQMPKKPFISYGFQDEAIDGLLSAIELGYDVAWAKSRTMGASWMSLLVYEYLWHFRDGLSFLLVSRNEDYVDKKGNPKSLFWKIDFVHELQPEWLLPHGRSLGGRDPNRKILHLLNSDTGSVIDGESTTGDVGRGDRRTAMLLDEFAAFDVSDGFRVLSSTRDASPCRLFNSTPQGASNAFYEVIHDSGAQVVRMHWSRHPSYNQGLYTSEKDEKGIFRLKKLDEFSGVVRVMRRDWEEPKDLVFPEDYPFILDGRLRSPWYDTQCSRCVTDQEVAQELDIDFMGSDYQYFDPRFIDKLIAEYCTPPVMKGRLRYDPSTLEPTGFEADEKGPLHLWFNIKGRGDLLDDRSFFEHKKFALGSDVSFGTGASNSATSVMDITTGRKVAVWRDPHTPPDKFAEATIALAKWFNNGFLIWDATGAPGRSFTKEVMEHKYSYIYFRRSEGRVRERISDQPGFYMNAEDRAVLLRDYRGKLERRSFINVSESGMRESLHFVVQPGGNIQHSSAVNSQNPAGAREAHGDEVIADALVCRVLTLKPAEVKLEEKKAPPLSMKGFMEAEQRELAAARVEADW